MIEFNLVWIFLLVFFVASFVVVAVLSILRLHQVEEENRSFLRVFPCELIKEKIPNVALTTDIIVGFPNESYEQFLETVSLCKEVRYDSAFTFIYSPRNNTPAAAIKDNVTSAEKSKRFKELVKALEEDIVKYSEEMVGKTYDVLVEGPSERNPEILSGYTEKNKLVHFNGNISLVGKIVKVKILESHTYSMIGELVND